jgi:hypothetical protein
MVMEQRKSRREARPNDGAARNVDSRTFRSRVMDDTDRYLAEMIGELERLARAHNRELLAHLLAIAGVQATDPNASCGKSNAMH